MVPDTTMSPPKRVTLLLVLTSTLPVGSEADPEKNTKTSEPTFFSMSGALPVAPKKSEAFEAL